MSLYFDQFGTLSDMIMIVCGCIILNIIYLKKSVSFKTMIGWNREKSRCPVCSLYYCEGTTQKIQTLRLIILLLNFRCIFAILG